MGPLEEALKLPEHPDPRHTNTSTKFDWDDVMLSGLHNLPHEQQKELIGDVFKKQTTELFYDMLTDILIEHPGLEPNDRADAIVLRGLLHEQIKQMEMEPDINLFKGRQIRLSGVDVLSYRISSLATAPSAFPHSLPPGVTLEATTAGIEFGPSYIRNAENRPEMDRRTSPLLAIHDVWMHHRNMPIQLVDSTELLYVPIDRQEVTIRPAVAFVRDNT